MTLTQRLDVIRLAFAEENYDQALQDATELCDELAELSS